MGVEGFFVGIGADADFFFPDDAGELVYAAVFGEEGTFVEAYCAFVVPGRMYDDEVDEGFEGFGIGAVFCFVADEDFGGLDGCGRCIFPFFFGDGQEDAEVCAGALEFSLEAGLVIVCSDGGTPAGAEVKELRIGVTYFVDEDLSGDGMPGVYLFLEGVDVIGQVGWLNGCSTEATFGDRLQCLHLFDEGSYLIYAVLYFFEVGHLVVWIMLLIFVVRKGMLEFVLLYGTSF